MPTNPAPPLMIQTEQLIANARLAASFQDSSGTGSASGTLILDCGGAGPFSVPPYTELILDCGGA